MDSSVSPKDEIWFLRVCHHISTGLYTAVPSAQCSAGGASCAVSLDTSVAQNGARSSLFGSDYPKPLPAVTQYDSFTFIISPPPPPTSNEVIWILCCHHLSTLPRDRYLYRNLDGTFLICLPFKFQWLLYITQSVVKQDRQCTYKRNFEARSCNHCCSGKTISSTYSVCVCVRARVCVAVGIQHAMRMCRIIYHLWSAPLYSIFPNYLINGTIFGKKLLNRKCVFWFSRQLLSETFLILRRTEWDVIKMYIRVLVKYTSFVFEFNETLIFSSDFRKYSNIKFHENLFIGSRVVPCGWTEANNFFPQTVYLCVLCGNSDYFPIQH